jgi:hypothetical protein
VAAKEANIISGVVAQNSSMHATATFALFRGSIEELPGMSTLLRDGSIVTCRQMIIIVKSIDKL